MMDVRNNRAAFHVVVVNVRNSPISGAREKVNCHLKSVTSRLHRFCLANVRGMSLAIGQSVIRRLCGRLEGEMAECTTEIRRRLGPGLNLQKDVHTDVTPKHKHQEILEVK